MVDNSGQSFGVENTTGNHGGSRYSYREPRFKDIGQWRSQGQKSGYTPVRTQNYNGQF